MRTVRTDASESPAHPSMISRSITASDSTTAGESSSPTRSANPTDRDAANRNAFARVRDAGPARATSSRVNAAAGGESDRGAYPAI